MDISLSHLRQNLFALADEVVRTGEPLCIQRRGVRLKLVRVDEVVATAGRLDRLRRQELTVGEALQPDESPAVWNTTALMPGRGLQAAEPEPARPVPQPPRARRR